MCKMADGLFEGGGNKRLKKRNPDVLSPSHPGLYQATYVPIDR